MTDSFFPYGTFPPDDMFRERYTQDYSRASRYPLPERLPYHHPLLRRLEGTYPFNDALPPWWGECVAQVKQPLARPLLAALSVREFRQGCLEQSQWKALRDRLSEEERRRLPTSPKIAALIAETGWSQHFLDRGPVETPAQLSLVISTHPRDFLYMSNGREWRSCQHFYDGCENQRLPGNFYDTGIAIAMVLALHTSVEKREAVLARTTLRVFPFQGRTVVAIGRTYHNNTTLAFLLLYQLAHLFDRSHLPWGFLVGVNSLTYCEDGSLGTALCERLDQEMDVQSEPYWLPHMWYEPYVDGGDREWERDGESTCGEYDRTQLNATVMLMHPRSFPQTLAPMRYALSRLTSAGMLPHFC